MRGLWLQALAGLAQRRGRSALAALGIALGAAMLATATVVGYGLETGFDRSARAADMPQVIARFDQQAPATIERRIAALPDLAAYTLGLETTDVGLFADGHFSHEGIVEQLSQGRPGYAIVAGRDLASGPGEAVVEQGVARAWGLTPGSTLRVVGLGALRVVGIADAPDDVAYPLAAPRVYVSTTTFRTRFEIATLPGPRGRRLGGLRAELRTRREARTLPETLPEAGTRSEAGTLPQVNVVQLWLRDPGELDQVLAQARVTSYGIRGLSFITREGVKVLIDEAGGIVIALLVALSGVALLTAGVMLAASARAEVQRRLTGIGVRRALGATRAHVTLTQSLEALIVAAPAGAIGVGVGILLATGPSDRLLEVINELPPGPALIVPLAGCWALTVAIPVLACTWPALRASARPPIVLMRGFELRSHHGRRSREAASSGSVRPHGRIGRGPAALGARLIAARRTRLAATLTVLGVSAAFILLMLALASELQTLQSDPGALGKRYQLTASLPASQTARVRGLPGVAAAAPRYETQALSAFSLGETIDVIAYPGDHTIFEAPALVAGHRLRGAREAEVGNGLAQVLGLAVGSTLAIELASGREARFQVAGIVNSLQHDGRVAYVSATALLAGEPSAPELLAVRLRPGVSSAAVSSELARLGASATATTGVTGTGRTLIEALSAILRVVALVDGLVCLYALVQALTLTAQERRGTIAVLRACGASSGTVRRLLAGAATAVVVPAAVIGVLLEMLVLGPTMGRLAAGYATLQLSAGLAEVCVVLVGLAILACAAVLWVARQANRQPIVDGLGA